MRDLVKTISEHANFDRSPVEAGRVGFEALADLQTAGSGSRIKIVEAAAELNPLGSHATLEAWLDPAINTVWCMTRKNGPVNYTRQLLLDLHDVADRIEELCVPQNVARPKFLITGSQVPGVYNLGGDLETFIDCVKKGDRNRLREYATSCVTIVHRSLVNFNAPIVSVALVQGDALGGGLEAALTFNFLIAERSARFGFPEVMFNSFLGMGAFSILSRRIGVKLAEKIILSGKLFSAEEFQAFGLVDQIVEDGAGKDAAYAFVKSQQKKASAICALNEARKKYHPVTIEELLDINSSWIDVVMQLDASSLKKMDFLVKAQKKLRNAQNPAA